MSNEDDEDAQCPCEVCGHTMQECEDYECECCGSKAEYEHEPHLIERRRIMSIDDKLIARKKQQKEEPKQPIVSGIYMSSNAPEITCSKCGAKGDGITIESGGEGYTCKKCGNEVFW